MMWVPSIPYQTPSPPQSMKTLPHLLTLQQKTPRLKFYSKNPLTPGIVEVTTNGLGYNYTPSRSCAYSNFYLFHLSPYSGILLLARIPIPSLSANPAFSPSSFLSLIASTTIPRKHLNPPGHLFVLHLSHVNTGLFFTRPYPRRHRGTCLASSRNLHIDRGYLVPSVVPLASLPFVVWNSQLCRA